MDKKQDKAKAKKESQDDKIQPETVKEQENKYLRALADYQNLIKRTEKERLDYLKYANERLIIDIIPVYDNLKMAIELADKKSHDSWLEGVSHVARQFKDILEGLGVKEVEVEGKEFDPYTMEAVAGSGLMVKKLLKSGYLLNGKLIVAARVALDDKNEESKDAADGIKEPIEPELN